MENYIDWIQAIERIIELRKYNVKKVFMLAILKLKDMPSYGMKH